MPGHYADIILPLSIEPLTFSTDGPLEETLRPGHAVTVTLGKRRMSVGIVLRLHANAPSYSVKTIDGLFRQEVLVPQEELTLWEWMAEYYMCSIGDVMRAALPSLLKPSALALDQEDTLDGFRLKTQRTAVLGSGMTDETALTEALDAIPARAKAQSRAAMIFCREAGGDWDGIRSGSVPVRRLAELGVSQAVLSKLAERGIISITETECGPEPVPDINAVLPTLSEAQVEALGQIKNLWGKNGTVLLHGVTSSGKTEIYQHLISEEILNGRSVLILLPEVADIRQAHARMESVFPHHVSCYSSRMTVVQRARTYMELCRDPRPRVVIGTRSAILLPIRDLGLIIVDEEHDRSHKQDEPAPRYSARDCAAWIARQRGIHTLLASATPSVESLYNAMCGKYGLVCLFERYAQTQEPEIVISDSLRSAKRGERKAHLNLDLREMIPYVISHGRKVILFQNRRGYSSYVECSECGWTPKCPNCSVALTYHMNGRTLKCHHCGHSEPMVTRCGRCSAKSIETRGFGTEQVGMDLEAMFPNARIDRLDGDSASSAGRYRSIMERFESGETDILVGTQMITKSFDFKNVGLVGVLNADNMLNSPDFRASERAFQCMVQVAGRAGRDGNGGHVIIQTSQPQLPVFSHVKAGDWRGMLSEELRDRKQYRYPPFSRLIRIIMKGPDQRHLESAADELCESIRKCVADIEVSSPYRPLVDRVSRIYICEILLRMVSGPGNRETKRNLYGIATSMSRMASFRSIRILFDVDPQ